MAPPRKSEEEKLEAAVYVRFTRADMKRFRKMAKARGIRPATLVREGALAHFGSAE